LDFEYFGLDDPVKLVCDVLLHPGMRLAAKHRKDFAESLFAACEAAGDLGVRLRYGICLPLWRIKWACILLNEFVMSDDDERLSFFSEEETTREERLFERLAKSKAMLEANVA
jgi:hypothetical protein